MSRGRSSYASDQQHRLSWKSLVLFGRDCFPSAKAPSPKEKLTTHSARAPSDSSTMPLATSHEPTISLSDLEPRVTATVAAIVSPETDQDREFVLRLVEIGFVPGETLRVIARGQPGNEPIAVRLGGTTFALRRIEAAFIRVSRAPAIAS